MAILHLSIRPFEICIFAIFKLTVFKFFIIKEDFVRTNDTFGVFNYCLLSSDIELGLGPCRITIFFI
jgi:hypothetical protein